jgi:hypothetical protein
MPDRAGYIQGLLLISILIIAGVVNSFVDAAGYETVGDFVWVLGYGGVVIVAWYIWFRPMEFGDPTGVEHRSSDESASRDGSNE